MKHHNYLEKGPVMTCQKAIDRIDGTNAAALLCFKCFVKIYDEHE